MTDTSFVAAPSTTGPYPVTVPEPSPTANDAVSDSAAPEEEPYTIKCICGFADDDGNTVFCEKCETWQHIECYYHDRNVPDEHYCVDCEPRPLDAKRATERQLRLREQGESGDRKVKRAGGKGQRKKPSRDIPDQPNGFHQRSESGVRDQPPSKKIKPNHRASASIGSQGPILPPPLDSRKRSSLPTRGQSPVKSPVKSTATATSSIPMYSNEFMHLYENDRGHADMDSNLFASLPLPTELASWVKDPAALARVAHGRPAREIFTWSDTALDQSQWPSLSTELLSDRDVEIDGRHPTWRILKTHDSVRKDGIVGEVKGKIGLLRDYCFDPENRWQELHHPEPFVFFHPQLPIYIDSRQEGSLLRYVRRSCRPNVTMKTFITNDVEYHFCFVAKEDIPANTEITAMWYLDPQLFEPTSANGVVKQESSDSAEEAAICLSSVLANFGCCACASDPPQNCLLASIDRRRHPKPIMDASTKQVNGRRKKPRSKSTAVSPVGGGGRGISNRAGSEGTKNTEYDDQMESRSASGSARARSRDITPTLAATSDVIFGESELSARDKRKIAAAERKFQQLERDERKRKKPTHVDTTFGDKLSRSPPASAVSPTSSAAAQRGSRKTSGSSNQASSRSPTVPGKYVDMATQTDPSESDVESAPQPRPANRPIFTCRAQRLLKRYQEDRIKLEEQQRRLSNSSLQDGATSHMDGVERTAASPTPGNKEDVKMKDVNDIPPSTGGSSGRRESENDGEDAEVRRLARPPLPPPWPSAAAHNARIPMSIAREARADLHISLPARGLPNSPSLPTPSPGTLTTPSPGSLEPPQTSLPTPSPVRKKLSLGDYIMRKGTMTTPTSEKPPTPATTAPPVHSPKGETKAGESGGTGPVSPDGPANDSSEPTQSTNIAPVSS